MSVDFKSPRTLHISRPHQAMEAVDRAHFVTNQSAAYNDSPQLRPCVHRLGAYSE